MDAHGLRLQFSQIVVRNALRFLDAIPFYFVGGVTALLSARGQRVGDIAANTIVIRVPVAREPDLSQVLPGKYNSFRDFPRLSARLRRHVTAQEAGIALQALIRRDALEAEARVNLFARLRERLERFARFPPEMVEGLSDEQYIRNVVDILFKNAG
jgi:hypothetical protein